MENINVKNVIISKQAEDSGNFQKFIKKTKKKKINIIIVNEGDRVDIEKNVYFDILWPDNNNLLSENALNNNSIVCKLHYNKFSMLFTGDIEKIAEQEIIYQYKNTNILNSTILKVAHHGSKTSSTQEFLNLIKPKIAIIGVGEDNTFGHPNKNIIERLQNKRCKNLQN